MRQLKLNDGSFAVVDADLEYDLRRLTDWRLNRNGSGRGYVVSGTVLGGRRWGRRQLDIPGPGRAIRLSKMVWLLRTGENPGRLWCKNLDYGDCRFSNLTNIPVPLPTARFPLVQFDQSCNCWRARRAGSRAFREYDEACRFAYAFICDRVGGAVYTLPPIPTSLYDEEARRLAERVVKLGLSYPLGDSA